MKDNSAQVSTGVGLPTLLTIVFVVLKLVPGNPVNDWSWWWVFSPLWISFLLSAAVLIFVGIFFLIIWRITK